MLATIITIGDELLLGNTIDTNSAWIASQLYKVGIEVVKTYTISDKSSEIVYCLGEAKAKSDLILITGGLGPTSDDITKETLAKYFGTKLVFNQAVSDEVSLFFSKRGLPYTERNKTQAMLPENAKILENKKGTAPGMWFEKNDKVFISMPGVPYEMKGIMENHILPILIKKQDNTYMVFRHVLCMGIGESFLADKLVDFEAALPEQIKLAYLPNYNKVKLRLTAKGNNKSNLENGIDTQIKKLNELIGEYIYGYDNDTLESIVGKLLIQEKSSIATAESCTGGFIAHKLTSIAGSSAYFNGACITYSNEMKSELLGVDKRVLDKHGAVSEEVVAQMLSGVKDRLKVDCAIAVSGIAGPSGGTKEKPVGTVWIGVDYKGKIEIRKFQFNGTSRQRNIELTTDKALDLLRKLLLNCN